MAEEKNTVIKKNVFISGTPLDRLPNMFVAWGQSKAHEQRLSVTVIDLLAALS